MKLSKMNNYQKNYTNQLLKNVKEKKYIHQLYSIWGVDLAGMQLIGKFNKEFRFFLQLIDVFSKYTWVVSLKDEKRYYNC